MYTKEGVFSKKLLSLLTARLLFLSAVGSDGQ